MRMPIPSRLRFQVLERDEFTCQYCGAKAPDAILHVDHVIAVVNGGPTVAENLLTACEACNMGKGAADLHYVPDHILNRAGRAYDRGVAMRSVVRNINGEAEIPVRPGDAPEAVVRALSSGAQALSVAIEASGLSQDFIAGAIGVSKSYVSCMRSGKRPITRKMIAPLCAATGTNLVRQYFDYRDSLDEASDVSRLALMMREGT